MMFETGVEAFSDGILRSILENLVKTSKEISKCCIEHVNWDKFIFL